MDELDIQSYVNAALALQGFELDADTRQEVALQFSRIQAIAATFTDLDLPADLESASVFRA